MYINVYVYCIYVDRISTEENEPVKLIQKTRHLLGR